MGRPTLLAERREQILAAFCKCLAENGLEGTSLDAVAAEAGLQRAAIRHFVGNRDQLIRASVTYLAERYEAGLSEALKGEPGVERTKAVLDGMFSGNFLAATKVEDDALDALMAAAAADDEIRNGIRDLFLTFETRIAQEIAAAHPDADPRRVAETAYAILCLVEQNSSLRWLGFPPDRSEMARKAAHTLLDQLGQ